jgi:hypothetical protein
MKSKKIYDKLMSLGVPVDRSYFTRNDALETNKDIWELQTILSKYKDSNSRHPILTFNSVVANPNFFQDY